MSRLQKFWNKINPPISPEEKRAVLPFDVYGDTDVGTRSHSGARVTEETAFTLSVAYSAMTLVADGVSALDPMALQEQEDGSLEQTTLPSWIRAPHPEIRRVDIFNQFMLSLLAWGNAYAMIIRRPTDGVIIALDVLHPAQVETEWDPEKRFRRRYRLNGTGPWLSSYEIFHVQGPTLPGDAKGLSVISQARESIGLGLTLEEFGARYFGQGSQAKIVIEMPNKVDATEAYRIVKTYERFHKGRNNWHRPAIMSGGAKLHNISINPDDAQFLDSRAFQAIEVARWFRVPPHRVGIIDKQSSWGSGLAEENRAMLQHTYHPWIQRLEEAFTAYIAGGQGRGKIVRLQTEDLLHGTFQDQVETYATLYEKQIITLNEARKPLGFPKRDDGDKIFEPPQQMGFGQSANPRTKEQDKARKQKENQS